MGLLGKRFRNGRGASAGQKYRFVRKEMLKVLDSSLTFQLQSGFINPGLSQFFPWLSGIAGNFEQYYVHRLIFKFESTSADNVSTLNTAIGVIGMGSSPDLKDPNLTSRYEFENYGGTVTKTITSTFAFNVPPAYTGSDLLFVRTGPVPATADQQQYDYAKFFWFTDAAQYANQIGTLCIYYDIEFFRPKLYDTLGGDVKFFDSFNTPVTVAEPLGTGLTHYRTNISPPPNIGPNSILFPAGFPSNFFLQLVWSGSSPLNIIYPSIIASANLVGVTAFIDSPTDTLGATISVPDSGSQTKMMRQYAFQIIDPTQLAELIFSGTGVYPTGTTSCRIVLFESPSLSISNPDIVFGIDS